MLVGSTRCSTPSATSCWAGGAWAATAPGRLLCAGCEAALERRAAPGVADPGPGRARSRRGPPTAYDGIVRAMVVGHKEHRLLALARPLGDLLAVAVRRPLADLGAPTRPRAAGAGPVATEQRPGARGYEPTTALTRCAAASRLAAASTYGRLRAAAPHPARAWPTRPGSTRPARAANLAGALRVHPAALRRWPGGRLRGGRPAHVVVCDDVLTTGRHGRRGAAGPARGRTAAAGAWRRWPRRRRPPPAAVGRSDDGHGGSGFWAVGSAITGHGLASDHGVRPGPWLRRPAPRSSGVSAR